jgi:hypothetical protein
MRDRPAGDGGRSPRSCSFADRLENVDQEEVAPGGEPQPLVGGHGEAGVALFDDHLRTGQRPPDLSAIEVTRGVVDDERLNVRNRFLRSDGREGASQQLRRLVMDNDHTDIRTSSGSSPRAAGSLPTLHAVTLPAAGPVVDDSNMPREMVRWLA